jgi:hypothetical protein
MDKVKKLSSNLRRQHSSRTSNLMLTDIYVIISVNIPRELFPMVPRSA